MDGQEASDATWHMIPFDKTIIITTPGKKVVERTFTLSDNYKGMVQITPFSFDAPPPVAEWVSDIRSGSEP